MSRAHFFRQKSLLTFHANDSIYKMEACIEREGMTMTDNNLWTQNISSGASAFSETTPRSARQEKKSDVAKTYAEILAGKMASIKDDLERMEKEREDIEEIDTLRRDAEERGTLRPSVETPETIRRVMGDGTILVTTTENGKIVEQYRKKPRLVPVSNAAAPPDAPTSDKVKMEPAQNLLDLLNFA